MYRIIDLETDAEKRKLILKEMTKLRQRELDIRDLQKIHLELLKIMHVANRDSDMFEDVSKTLFIVSHYSQITNGMTILLESLYLCKLVSMNNPYVKTKINKCINIIGNYTIDKELINMTTTVFLAAHRYLELMNTTLDKDMLLKFISTTATSEDFVNTSFYIMLLVYFEDNQDNPDKYLEDLFESLKCCIKSQPLMRNYLDFIRWYLEQLDK